MNTTLPRPTLPRPRRAARGLAALATAVLVAIAAVSCRASDDDITITTVPAVELDCAEDRERGDDNVSQSAAVLYEADVADGGPTLHEVTDEVTMTYLDGRLTPNHLDVAVGTMIAIHIPDEGRQGEIAIGCSNGRNTLRGDTTGFFMAEAGTYPVVDDQNGQVTIGTITVS